MLTKHWSALALSLVSAACTTTTVDEVLGRYSTAHCENADGSGRVACSDVVPGAMASAVSIKTPAATSASSGTSFSERALAQYIRTLSHYSDDAKTLRANLAAALSAERETPDIEDRSVFHRTLIVSVFKTGRFNAADRLEATEIKIALDNARFDSWDALATTFSNINAGTLQLAQARGMTQSITAGIPAGGPTLNGTFGASQTDTRTETMAAAAQVENVTATIEDDGKTLVIHRQGGYGIDLSGNVVIKVDIAYGARNDDTNRPHIFSFTGYKKDGVYQSSAKVDVSEHPAVTLPSGKDVRAKISLHYTLRHVDDGGGTYEERDDDVREITGDTTTPGTVVIIPHRESAPPLYGLHRKRGDAWLAASVDRSLPHRMCFNTYEEAQKLLDYMNTRNHPSSIGHAKIGLHDAGIVEVQRDDLREFHAEADCDVN